MDAPVLLAGAIERPGGHAGRTPGPRGPGRAAPGSSFVRARNPPGPL
jgi:hypothetical protein